VTNKIHKNKRNLSINNNIKKPKIPKYTYPSSSHSVLSSSSTLTPLTVSNTYSNVPVPKAVLTTSKNNKVLTGNKRKDRTVDGWSKLDKKSSLFIRYTKEIKRDIKLLCKEMKLKRPTDVCRALIKQRAEVLRKAKHLDKEMLVNTKIG
jgi:hypothetical protein